MPANERDVYHRGGSHRGSDFASAFGDAVDGIEQSNTVCK